MGKRKNSRTKMVLPLRVWGTDATGKTFMLMAHTLDVSPTGARLGGFRSQVAPGDVVGVQYRMQKQQFRVAWVGRPGTSRDSQIGIEYLDRERKILGLELPRAETVDEYQPPEGQDETEKLRRQRMHVRYSVSGGADVSKGDETGIWGSLIDISLGGCYVQTITPFTVHHPVKVLLKVENTEIETHGVVRTSHPDVGMGIQFTDTTRPEDRARLRELINQLRSGEAAAPAPGPAKPDSSHLSQRLQAASAELVSISELMKSIGPDPLVLRQFRDTLSHVRTTSWAVQKWLELEGKREDMFPVLTYLNNERVQVASGLCRSLCKDLQTMDLKLEQSALEELLRSVEDLFAHLAGFSMADTESPSPAKQGESAVSEMTNVPIVESAAAGEAGESGDITTAEQALAAAAGSSQSHGGSRPVAPGAERVVNPTPNRKSKHKKK